MFMAPESAGDIDDGVDPGIETRYVRTRSRLHGIAECLMAGPQRRRVGRLRLRATLGGFATTGEPTLRLMHGDLVVNESRRLPLAGSLGDLATAAGVDFGAPVGDYPDGSGALATDVLDLDDAAMTRITDWFVLGDSALRVVDPTQVPVLWPEHFDVAIEVNAGSVVSSLGCSAGDGFHAAPYAYVSTSYSGSADYWNAPFGALAPADGLDLPGVVDFWREGLKLVELGS
ncbi:MAG: hypothetical protein ACRCYQ_04520 [Nocardioides sp.]